MNRRRFFTRTAGLAALGLAGRGTWLSATGLFDEPTLTIYKSRSCGCCAKWVDHVKANRFRAVVHDREEMDEVKDWLGVPRDLRSCHTAQVEGYVIEGHVPASDIRALLAKRPKVLGLAAPGMPKGSPGMEMLGEPADKYDVMSFAAAGKTAVFARH